MTYSTSNTYQLTRKILTFTGKISRPLPKPDKKFTTDITYGMLAPGSCLLTDVVNQLHESVKKAITLLKHVPLRPTIIQSVFSQGYILPQKRIINLQIP